VGRRADWVNAAQSNAVNGKAPRVGLRTKRFFAGISSLGAEGDTESDARGTAQEAADGRMQAVCPIRIGYDE